MSSYFLDSSVILAFLNQETGVDDLDTYFLNGRINTVNTAEVLTKLIEQGQDRNTAQENFSLLRLDVVDFDLEHALKVAELRPLTRHLGLSLGDRSCLASSIIYDATAVTADRAWKGLSFCPIEVIR